MSSDSAARITPAEVLAAYRKTGLTPQRYVFFCKNCGCPLTAIYLAVHGGSYSERKMEIDDWAGGIYGDEYAGGFVEGADGWSSDDYDIADPEYKAGYDDGSAAWQAVQAAVAAGTIKSKGDA